MDRTTATALGARLGARLGAGARPVVALAPGRVNLVGEHVDYNDGWVLPVALDRHVAVAAAPRADGAFAWHAEGEAPRVARRDAPAPDGPLAAALAVAAALEKAGVAVPGADIACAADLPAGAGLSSSAALHVALALALLELAGARRPLPGLAALCQGVEERLGGVRCGLMDPYASLAGRAGAALLVDCRAATHEEVPLPSDAALLVLDTGVRRPLAGGAYNERRAACERAADALRRRDGRVRALRDADIPALAAARPDLDAVTFRRALFVLEELPRPAACAAALRAGDLVAAGRLLDESHAGLRDLFDASCAELNLIVGLACAQEACYGARLTGAGFGGCGVALVEARHAPHVAREVQSRYRERSGLDGQVWVARAADGAVVFRP